MTLTLELNDEHDTLKMIRETLCRVQNTGTVSDALRIQRIIDEVDRQWPLESDGTANTPPEEKITAESGWVAPSEVAYPFFDIPSVTAHRGGIAFTNPRSRFTDLSHDQMVDLVLQKEAAIRRVQKQRDKANRKVRRLLKIIERNL